MDLLHLSALDLAIIVRVISATLVVTSLSHNKIDLGTRFMSHLKPLKSIFGSWN